MRPIHFERWTTHEIRRGEPVDQYLACVVGSLLTLLPAFLLMPALAIVGNNYKIVVFGSSTFFARAAMAFFCGLGLWLLILWVQP